MEELGPRETEILRLRASGFGSETIAELQNLSHKTVRNHHYAIKTKIGARNEAHLVWIAVRGGLVSIEDARMAPVFEADAVADSVKASFVLSGRRIGCLASRFRPGFVEHERPVMAHGCLPSLSPQIARSWISKPISGLATFLWCT